MERTLRTFFLVVLAYVAAAAQSQKTLDEAVSPKGMEAFQAERAKLYQWPGWQFLFGNWQTKAAAEPQAAGNRLTVTRELNDKALIITYNQPLLDPAPGFQRASGYKGFIVVYLEGLSPRASLFDNEGHSITYDVTTTEAPKKIAFVQPATGAASGSRITIEEKAGALAIEAATIPPAGRAGAKPKVKTFTAEKLK